MVNFVIKSVMSNEVTNDVMMASATGVEAYETFVAERITGNGNV